MKRYTGTRNSRLTSGKSSPELTQFSRHISDVIKSGFVNKEAVVAKPAPAPVKLKKKRKERSYRTFTYRGIVFFMVAKGENTQVCVIKDGEPKPIIEVPRAQAMKAVRAISKIELAETFLDGLNVKPEVSA